MKGFLTPKAQKNIIHAPDAPLYPSELDIADSYPPSEPVLPEADAVKETAPEVAPREKVQLRKKEPSKKEPPKKAAPEKETPKKKEAKQEKQKEEEKKITQAAPKKTGQFYGASQKRTLKDPEFTFHPV